MADTPENVRKSVRLQSVIAALLAGAVCVPIHAADTAPAGKVSDGTIEEVVITGSSIKGLNVETALPVTVLTRGDIDKSGVANMEQLTQSIVSTAAAGATRGSDMAGLSTYGVSSISLRGLGDNRTLVLVDGRRVAAAPNGGTSAAVDVNSIPLSAIEQVEVLRDGASSSYGSDAVAGVVNFILRKEFNGIQLTADVGQPTAKGGGDVGRYGVVFGRTGLSGGHVSLMAGGDWELSTALGARERPFSATGNQFPYFQAGATPTGRIEGIWIPGQTVAQNARSATNPFGYSSSGYGNPAYPDCAGINMFNIASKGGVGGNFNNCNFDSAPFVGLFPRTLHTDAFAHLKAELTPAATLNVDYQYSNSQQTEAFQPSPLRIQFLSTDNAFAGSGVDPALLIYPGNPNYQSIVVPYLQAMDATVPGIFAAMNGQPLAVSLRTFLTGPRTERDTNNQTRFSAGVEGRLRRWDYSVYFGYGEGRTSGTVIDGYFSQLALARILNNPASNWNPWAPHGEQDPALTAQLQSTKYIGPTLGGRSSLASLEATASTSLADLTAGPLQMAVGAAHRRDTYIVDVPDILGSGDIAGLGGATLPENSNRMVDSVYTEFNAPLHPTLQLNLSARYDKYNDVGGALGGKLSARWQPLHGLLVRAAVGRGFRAPTLVELHLPSSVGTSESFIDPAHPENGTIQVNSLRAGNTHLNPEKSTQYSFGVVVTPVSNMTLSADYFNIDIGDYIIGPSALSLVIAAEAGHPLYGPGDVTFAPDGTVFAVDQTLRNAASAKLDGVDLSLKWSRRFSLGEFNVSTNSTYMHKFDLQTLANMQHSVGTIVQDNGTSPLDALPNGTGVIPRWRHTGTVGWSYGHWDAALTHNYYSGYIDGQDLNGRQNEIPAQSLFDVQVGFSGIRNLKLSVGARNVFDRKPPIYIGNGSSFQAGYDPSMYDPRGRVVYARLTYKPL